jgi:hypothetical protein
LQDGDLELEELQAERNSNIAEAAEEVERVRRTRANLFIAKSRELDSVAAGYTRDDDDHDRVGVGAGGDGSEFEEVARIRGLINPSS